MSNVHMHPTGWRRSFPTILISIILVFAYSIIRYHVIKGVPWENFPLFISNKGFALSAVVLIALSYLIGTLARFFPNIFDKKLYMRRYLGLAGFGAAAIHTLISLMLLRPHYYSKFFEGDALNLVGELSMIFGVLSLFIFSLVAVFSFPSVISSMKPDVWRSLQRRGYYAFIFTMAHVFTMGIKGWQDPTKWPGGLLPISLVAFIIILFTLLVKSLTLIADLFAKPVQTEMPLQTELY